MKLLVIVGPTASGKTTLSIKLAKKFNGEIVSADSRQIYKGMDIGTAKPLRNQKSKIKNQKYLVNGVAHWLLDIKNPNQIYTVAEYKKEAVKIIRQILKRKKLPILCGGTGLYVQAVTENLDIPKVKANPLLRKRIEKEIKKRGLNYVFKKLVKLDPESAYLVDPKNPRRVIRALEVVLSTKKPFSQQRRIGKPIFEVLKIGISLPKEKLREKINLRVEKMLKNGLIEEVEKLTKKYGSNQPAFDAIGYREIIQYLNKKITLQEAIKNIKMNTWRYAKKQMTWFKRDKKIHWVKNYKEAEKLTKQFLK